MFANERSNTPIVLRMRALIQGEQRACAHDGDRGQAMFERRRSWVLRDKTAPAYATATVLLSTVQIHSPIHT